ncbi:MAG: roadblock/LC7 domain-containing protein [Deltaproteobacteria bacterium]|nr:roadblock/LC7 domain-containing protein [Deltaproteobacteria bacterium]
MTISRRFVPQRDLQKTAFTRSLREMVADVPGLQAVAFCDEEGEVVDYHSYLEPYDTKIAGAVLGLLLSTVAREGPRLCAGGLRELVIETDEHVLFARRMAGDYCLAGVLGHDGVLAKLLSMLDEVEARILAEAGM